ncbi:hypothetical protein MKQ68_19770 [Chitinophaga horti]|uniref:TolC family protein n=1 Tax=Chitinophaga horti TaxID=2920382 RepID=A0ABY6J2E9_9BACT|nr:hypothetical protein [Chitinophaga horti]UYQ92327.1 hypothetical protein MKQ68_19770 [Chitinophaga horti]
MFRLKTYTCAGLLGICLAATSCRVPAVDARTEDKSAPDTFAGSGDTSNIASIQWRQFFTDRDLANLIDTALVHNQELQITLQEIVISRNEVRLKKPLSCLA